MSENNLNLLKALNSFGNFKSAMMDTDPTNQKTLNALKSASDGGSAWDGDPPAWDDVAAKVKEFDDADAKAKEDKLSAYRKLSMTDDEIKAIDPTLLEE